MRRISRLASSPTPAPPYPFLMSEAQVLTDLLPLLSPQTSAQVTALARHAASLEKGLPLLQDDSILGAREKLRSTLGPFDALKPISTRFLGAISPFPPSMEVPPPRMPQLQAVLAAQGTLHAQRGLLGARIGHFTSQEAAGIPEGWLDGLSDGRGGVVGASLPDQLARLLEAAGGVWRKVFGEEQVPVGLLGHFAVPISPSLVPSSLATERTTTLAPGSPRTEVCMDQVRLTEGLSVEGARAAAAVLCVAAPVRGTAKPVARALWLFLAEAGRASKAEDGEQMLEAMHKAAAALHVRLWNVAATARNRAAAEVWLPAVAAAIGDLSLLERRIPSGRPRTRSGTIVGGGGEVEGRWRRLLPLFELPAVGADGMGSLLTPSVLDLEAKRGMGVGRKVEESVRQGLVRLARANAAGVNALARSATAVDADRTGARDALLQHLASALPSKQHRQALLELWDATVGEDMRLQRLGLPWKPPTTTPPSPFEEEAELLPSTSMMMMSGGGGGDDDDPGAWVPCAAEALERLGGRAVARPAAVAALREGLRRLLQPLQWLALSKLAPEGLDAIRRSDLEQLASFEHDWMHPEHSSLLTSTVPSATRLRVPVPPPALVSATQPPPPPPLHVLLSPFTPLPPGATPLHWAQRALEALNPATQLLPGDPLHPRTALQAVLLLSATLMSGKQTARLRAAATKYAERSLVAGRGGAAVARTELLQEVRTTLGTLAPLVEPPLAAALGAPEAGGYRWAQVFDQSPHVSTPTPSTSTTSTSSLSSSRHIVGRAPPRIRAQDVVIAWTARIALDARGKSSVEKDLDASTFAATSSALLLDATPPTTPSSTSSTPSTSTKPISFADTVALHTHITPPPPTTPKPLPPQASPEETLAHSWAMGDVSADPASLSSLPAEGGEEGEEGDGDGDGEGLRDETGGGMLALSGPRFGPWAAGGDGSELIDGGKVVGDVSDVVVGKGGVGDVDSHHLPSPQEAADALRAPQWSRTMRMPLRMRAERWEWAQDELEEAVDALGEMPWGEAGPFDGAGKKGGPGGAPDAHAEVWDGSGGRRKSGSGNGGSVVDPWALVEASLLSRVQQLVGNPAICVGAPSFTARAPLGTPERSTLPSPTVHQGPWARASGPWEHVLRDHNTLPAWSEEEEQRTVMIQGVPPGVSAEEIKAAVEVCGEVQGVRVLDERARLFRTALQSKLEVLRSEGKRREKAGKTPTYGGADALLSVLEARFGGADPEAVPHAHLLLQQTPRARSQAARRSTLKQVEQLISANPTHAFVTFRSRDAAVQATSDPLRIFGTTIRGTACKVLTASDARFLHLSPFPAGKPPAWVAAFLSLHLGPSMGLWVRARDRRELSSDIVSSGEVLIEFRSAREALAAERVLLAACRDAVHARVVEKGLEENEWWAQVNWEDGSGEGGEVQHPVHAALADGHTDDSLALSTATTPKKKKRGRKKGREEDKNPKPFLVGWGTAKEYRQAGVKLPMYF